MNKAQFFNDAALAAVHEHLEQLRTGHTYSTARTMRAAEGRDIVVAGKEVQLTIFRQVDLPILRQQVLVTVQLARHGLGGVISFRLERGLVFSPDAPPRDATAAELQASAS